jgi:hypothetical protein
MTAKNKQYLQIETAVWQFNNIDEHEKSINDGRSAGARRYDANSGDGDEDVESDVDDEVQPDGDSDDQYLDDEEY